MNRDGGAKQQLLTACYLGLPRIDLSTGSQAVTPISPGDPRPRPQCGSSEVRVGHLGQDRFLAAIEPWHGNQLVVYLPLFGQLPIGFRSVATDRVCYHLRSGRSRIEYLR